MQLERTLGIRIERMQPDTAGPETLNRAPVVISRIGGPLRPRIVSTSRMARLPGEILQAQLEN